MERDERRTGIFLLAIGFAVILVVSIVILMWTPISPSNTPFLLGITAASLICLGIPFICFGIKKTTAVLESKRSKGRFLIFSGSILLGLIVYFLIILLPVVADFKAFIIIVFLIMIAPILMIGLGSRAVSKSRRNSIIKESIETKMEAVTNVTYMLRIEKKIGESGVERINYICGYCGVKNNLKSIDEEHGIFQCLNCGAENHLIIKEKIGNKDEEG